jgi:hypothetical protein
LIVCTTPEGARQRDTAAKEVPSFFFLSTAFGVSHLRHKHLIEFIIFCVASLTHPFKPPIYNMGVVMKIVLCVAMALGLASAFAPMPAARVSTRSASRK